MLGGSATIRRFMVDVAIKTGSGQINGTRAALITALLRGEGNTSAKRRERDRKITPPPLLPVAQHQEGASVYISMGGSVILSRFGWRDLS